MEVIDTKPKTEEEEKVSLWTKIKKKASSVGEACLEFIVENPAIALPVLSGLGMLFGGAAKLVTGSGSRRLERCKVQDDVTEEYFLTKHPLTNDEIMELGDRMVDGERKGEALEDMGLLRKERKRKA